MTKNTQEYLNGLINKSRMFYLDLSQHVVRKTVLIVIRKREKRKHLV